jgi:hypothetical protein
MVLPGSCVVVSTCAGSTGLGARVLAWQEHWVTMAEPEGNEFDVMPN